MKRFIKRPIVVLAVQWNGNTNQKEVEAFVGRPLEAVLESETAYLAGQGAPLFSLTIPTLEGYMKANPKDWIIKGVNGEVYPCKPDIFEKTYDALDEE